jgi:hypothetical protein
MNRVIRPAKLVHLKVLLVNQHLPREEGNTGREKT